jgi:hypothetical protein
LCSTMCHLSPQLLVLNYFPICNFMNQILIAIKAPYGIAPKVPGLDEASRSNDIFVMSRT